MPPLLTSSQFAGTGIDGPTGVQAERLTEVSAHKSVEYLMDWMGVQLDDELPALCVVWRVNPGEELFLLPPRF